MTVNFLNALIIKILTYKLVDIKTSILLTSLCKFHNLCNAVFCSMFEWGYKSWPTISFFGNFQGCVTEKNARSNFPLACILLLHVLISISSRFTEHCSELFYAFWKILSLTLSCTNLSNVFTSPWLLKI